MPDARQHAKKEPAQELRPEGLTVASWDAGATFLPAKDAEDARQAVSVVLSGSLNATEAIAWGFGLKPHVEQRAEREAAMEVGASHVDLACITPMLAC